MPSIRSGRRPATSRALCVVLLFSALCLAEREARAQNQVVNRCASDVEPGGVNLAGALAAGGRITFNCGGPATITITRQHSITRSIDVDGANQITLDGNGQTPFLSADAPDAAVRLANVTVRRMFSTNQSGVLGGQGRGRISIVNSRILESELPIAVSGPVTIEDSVFEGNRNAVIGAASVTIARSRFRANDAIPIFSRTGRVEIVDSVFEGNRTGSVFRGCTGVSVVRTSFVDNAKMDTGPDTGGGAFTTGCPTDVVNGTFTGNTSQSNGGAVRVLNTAVRVSFRGSRFSGNQAVLGGGAVSVQPPGPTPLAIVLRQTIFSGNAAQNGGALHFEESGGGVAPNARLEGQAVTFSANRAADRGGAIGGKPAVVNLTRGVFVRNEAQAGAAVWIDTPLNAQSAFVNSLFVLNQAPQGTFNGRSTQFINSTVLGSVGPGLALLPAGGPAQAIQLTNTIVENNSGGNCPVDPGRVVDGGANLQFPGTSCGPGIPVAPALLDSFYAPLVGGPARAGGRDDVCRGAAVQGVDVYGTRRPQADHCSIGAVEGDMDRTIASLQAAKPSGPTCADGSARTRRGCPEDGTADDDCPQRDRSPSVARPRPARSGAFLSAAEVLPLLLDAGIDFSVPRSDIVDFLDNSEFTPYPAIADALLKLTRVRPLRCPVFLDVIVFNYEHSPGEPSPRRAADVDFTLLRSAVVEGYNNRYGRSFRDFESLLR
jgi:predicted outer membrane repeat protein